MASPRSRLSWPLIILCGVLGFVFYLSSNSDPPIPAMPALSASASPDPGMADPAPVPDFALKPIGDYAETLARPIFAETRRPPAPEPEPEAPPAPTEAPPPAEAPPKPGLTISGIVISSSGRFALIRDAGSRNLKRISIGDDVGGWRVARIEVNRIELSYGDAREVYELKDQAAPAKKKKKKSTLRQLPASTPSQPTARKRAKPARTNE